MAAKRSRRAIPTAKIARLRSVVKLAWRRTLTEFAASAPVEKTTRFSKSRSNLSILLSFATAIADLTGITATFAYLRFLLLFRANFPKHAAEERQEFVQAVKALRLVRCYVFNPALDSSALDIRIWIKPNHESRLVLQSVHRRHRIVRFWPGSHKRVVQFRFDIRSEVTGEKSAVISPSCSARPFESKSE